MTTVLVVGAGPTGLTAAAELARRGVSVRVIDQQSRPAVTSRALVVQSRTLEVFDDMGIVEQALNVGRPADQLTAVIKGRPFRFDLGAQLSDRSDLYTAYPNPQMIPQDVTERLLTEHLLGLGVPVERGVVFEDLDQDADGVRARLRGTDGTEEVVTVRWVIGADGAHSRVRSTVGIPFEGTTYAEEFIQADARLAWDLPDGELYIFPAKDGIFAAWAMPGPGRFRIFGSVPANARDDASTAPAQGDLQALMDQRSSVPGRIVSTSWTARYRLHRRSVPRFREGRVFLAGDAAHIHSPAGAQGMNTGIQDAYNLAWKIAAVEHGHAHADILDSYTAERHPVATRLLRTTDRGFSIAAAQHPLARLFRAIQPRMLPHAVARPRFRRLVAGLFSQLRISYPDSPLNSHDGPMRHGPRPGDRAREVVVGGQRLFELLRGTHYTVLLFVRDADTSPARALASTLTNRYGTAVHTHIVSMRAGADVLTDPDGSAHERYSAGTAYVIRPDGHIAYRGTPIQPDLLQADLDRRVAPLVAVESGSAAGV